VTSFQERLRVPALWWVVSLLLAVGGAAEIHGGAGGLQAVVPYAVLPPLALAGLALLSRGSTRVADGQLHVPGARAPLTAFGEPQVLDRVGLRQWRGPRAQRDAWVRVRPWLTRAVLLPVTDPDDDTPYWLIGSRRPEELAEACRR
jgi:hypothetical protein